ncbi:MAG: hypothetical protein DRQ55_00970 [Planctomycetota bacterium]|nr:MAG: hypothetical protein DRQ55_00970 [Planctomycetota bacterium]
MPIMVRSSGSPAEGGVQTSYIVIATGVSERIAGGLAGERELGGGDEGREPVAPQGSEPVSVEDGQAVVASHDFFEDNLLADADQRLFADVHLVWTTGGLTLVNQPPGTSLDSDAATGLTRLTFSKVELSPSSWSTLTAVWGSALFDLACVPGEGDQVVTGFLCRPGQLPPDALASHSMYLACERRSLSLLARLLQWLFG